MVPKADFDPKEIKSYLKHQAFVGDDWDFRYDSLDNSNLIVCYAMPSFVKNALDNKLANWKTHHISSCLINYTKENSENIEIMVFVDDSKVHVLGIPGGNLVIYNQYKYETADDLLYYVLLAYQQCGLDPHAIPLYIGGKVLEESPLYKKLYTYIKTIHFTKFQGDWSFGEMPAHRFLDAYATVQCG